jgi:putative Ca2+/H+ antiporter (TMEM165/GDT1 family)
MIGYAIWKLSKIKGGQTMDDRLEREEKKLSSQFSEKQFWSIVLGIIPMLVLLDLAGDATEILTIVFVAQYQDALLVFVGALTALVSATALETTLGNQLSKYLSFKKIQLFSPIVFLIVGLATILTTIL